MAIDWARYISVEKGFAEPFVVVLKVDHQSFRIMPEWETREEADFAAAWLGVALERMVAQVRG